IPIAAITLYITRMLGKKLGKRTDITIASTRRSFRVAEYRNAAVISDKLSWIHLKESMPDDTLPEVCNRYS
ncbi:12358_t:CDS:1, partial [Funneliformis geosporum]